LGEGVEEEQVTDSPAAGRFHADDVHSWTGVPYLTAEQVAQIHSVDEFEPLARERTTRPVADYVAGWAGSGATTRMNREAFWRYVLRPRTLVDVTTVDLSTTVFGRRIALPVILGPSGYQALSHPQAELATARAAERLGTVMGLSTSSNFSIEEVAALTRDPWFQLYWFSDEGVTKELIERAAAAGFAAIAVTVDAPTDLWREGEARDPIDIPDDVLSVNLPDRPLTRASHVTWDHLGWLRSLSPMKILLKGVLTAEDALLAAGHGVDGLIVSNHGGRALDWSIPTLDALPEIVDAVGDRLEIYMDGGVRRGSDVMKALALGARAVLLGRPVPWALAAGGEAAVVRMVELVRGELETAMALCGATSVDKIDRSMVARAGAEVAA
jgi:4-hydroxymandelate oxidase